MVSNWDVAICAFLFSFYVFFSFFGVLLFSLFYSFFLFSLRNLFLCIFQNKDIFYTLFILCKAVKTFWFLLQRKSSDDIAEVSMVSRSCGSFFQLLHDGCPDRPADTTPFCSYWMFMFHLLTTISPFSPSVFLSPFAPEFPRRGRSSRVDSSFLQQRLSNRYLHTEHNSLFLLLRWPRGVHGVFQRCAKMSDSRMKQAHSFCSLHISLNISLLSCFVSRSATEREKLSGAQMLQTNTSRIKPMWKEKKIAKTSKRFKQTIKRKAETARLYVINVQSSYSSTWSLLCTVAPLVALISDVAEWPKISHIYLS